MPLMRWPALKSWKCHHSYEGANPMSRQHAAACSRAWRAWRQRNRQRGGLISAATATGWASGVTLALVGVCVPEFGRAMQFAVHRGHI